MGQDRPEGDEVGVDAAVGLSVGVSRTEQRAGQFVDPPFDCVDVVAARVEAVTRTFLRVLVAQPVAHRQQHRWTREVLAGDELEVGALIRQLPKNGVGHGGIDSCDSVERSGESDSLRGDSVGRETKLGEIPGQQRADGHGGLLVLE